ncbi:MAG: sodium:alanine symporter family protein [bacterium]
MQVFQKLIEEVSVYFSSILMIPLLGVGIYLTWRLRLVQMVRFGHSWKVVAGVYDREDDQGDINHMQALSAALSATIGIGNIAGVATAIHFGGPGALFWMWVSAFLGMATKFSEATLAMVYRKFSKDGTAAGGPMYYIEMGLGRNWKWMAVIFAICTIFSSFGTGNSIQAFTVADSFKTDLGIPQWITGLAIATIVGLVIIGGIRRIGVVASRLVPFMAAVYIFAALWIVWVNIAHIPEAFHLIFTSAFTAQGAIGGFAGATFFQGMLWGIRRGIYSNEAGQGSAPIAHAAAKTDEPVREGTVAMIGPFLDTLVICTLTGLTIITSGAWKTPYKTTMAINELVVVQVDSKLKPGGMVDDNDRVSGVIPVVDGRVEGVCFIYNHSNVVDPAIYTSTEGSEATPLIEGMLLVKDGYVDRVDTPSPGGMTAAYTLQGKALRNGSPLTAQAFETGLPGKWGGYVVTFGVLLFAVSTAISWSYYGDRAITYLIGPRGVRPYRYIYVLIVFIGANASLGIVWSFGDIVLSMMAIPNLAALFLLAPKIQQLKENYFSREHVPVRKWHL